MSNTASGLPGLGGNVIGCSPIQSLPTELLHEIFLHCISNANETSGFLRFPRPSLTKAPLKLGRICSWWRKLVLSIASLWSQISLYSATGEGNISTHPRILDEWFARSQQTPLWLSICYRHTPTASLWHKFDMVIAKLIPRYNRWRYLELELPSACIRPVLAKLSACSTSLKYLHIVTQERSGGDQLSIDLSRQCGLTDLSLYSFFTHTYFVGHHRAIHHIRVLDVIFPTIDDYFCCLDLCPSVDDLRLYFGVEIDFRPSVSQPLRIIQSITKLSLRMAHFTFNETFDMGPFLDCFQLPSLAELKFYPMPMTLKGSRLEPWTHMSDLLERSKSPLKSLHVVHPIREYEFCNCLRNAPDLEMLLAECGSFDNPTLDTLAPRLVSPQQPLVCPRLRHIEVELRYGGGTTGFYSAAELVLRRWGGAEMDLNSSYPSRICTVVLKVINDFDVGSFLYYEYPKIRERIKDGLLVTSFDRDSHKTVYTYDHNMFSPENLGEWHSFLATKGRCYIPLAI